MLTAWNHFGVALTQRLLSGFGQLSLYYNFQKIKAPECLKSGA